MVTAAPVTCSMLIDILNRMLLCLLKTSVAMSNSIISRTSGSDESVSLQESGLRIEMETPKITVQSWYTVGSSLCHSTEMHVYNIQSLVTIRLL